MITFRYTGHTSPISILEPFIGHEGWLRCSIFRINTFEEEEHVFLAGIADDGTPLDADCCRRLFSLAGEEELLGENIQPDVETGLNAALAVQRATVVEDIAGKNKHYFEDELEKLDRWGEDQRNSLKTTLRELEDEIRQSKKLARLAPNIPEKLSHERHRRTLETKRDEAWKAYEGEARRIDQEKDGLLDSVEARLKQEENSEVLFTLRWRVT